MSTPVERAVERGLLDDRPACSPVSSTQVSEDVRGPRMKQMKTLSRLYDDGVITKDQYVQFLIRENLVSMPDMMPEPDPEPKPVREEPRPKVKRPSFWKAVWDLTAECIPFWLLLAVFALFSMSVGRMAQYMIAPDVILIRWVTESILMSVFSCGLISSNRDTLRKMETSVKYYQKRFQDYRDHPESPEQTD